METLNLSGFKKLNRWLLIILILGFLASIFGVNSKTQKKSSRQDLTAQTIPVKNQDWMSQIEANGVVKAERKINISPEESGRIDRLYVTEGDRISKGQLIARMNNQQLQTRVNQYIALLAKTKANLAQQQAGTRPEEIARAKAQVVSAKAAVKAARVKLKRATQEFNRYQAIAIEGAISQNDLEKYFIKQQEASASLEVEVAKLDREQENLQQAFNGPRSEEIAMAKAEVESVKAELSYYQIQLEKTILQAPFAGIITRRFAQEGDFVTPTTSASTSAGATSTSIAELSSGLEIEANILEAKIGQIYVGQTVNIQTNAYPNKTFQGKVRLISPSAIKQDNITSFKVKVALISGQEILKIGMNLKLIFLSSPIENALVIPISAVLTNSEGETGVYVQDKEGRATWRIIEVSEVSGNLVRVLQGLTSQERILIVPPSELKIEGIDSVLF